MKKTASFQTIVLLLLLCLAAPLSSAYAEVQGVATVVALRGTVVAQGKGGAARNLSLKSQIFQEDVLKTDKTGQLQIMFTDSSIISLGRDSEMKIAEYRWQPEQKDGALKTQVKEGTFRVMGGALAKDAPQNFKTETPTATIGIRGSMYAFKSTADSLSVVFQGGKGIEIFNDLGKVTITVPGFGTHVVLNTPPAKPSKFTEKELNNLNKGLNGNGGNAGGGSSGEGGGTGSGNGNGGDNGDGGGGGNGKSDTGPLGDAIKQTDPIIHYDVDTRDLDKRFYTPPPPPTDGIFTFEGELSGLSIDPITGDITDSFVDDLSMGVNWHNRRVFGIVYDKEKGNPVFFFGTITGSIVSNITIMGIDEDWENYIYSILGSGIGVFTGSGYDFFGFGATGASYNIIGEALHDFWTVAGGAQLIPGAKLSAAPTGTENWKGYVTGVSANLGNPSDNSLAFYRSTSNNGLNLTVNKDTGIISGLMSPGNELQDSSYNSIFGLVVGGDESNSAYIYNDAMFAIINDCVGDCSSILKSMGNLLVTAPPDEQFSDYVSWGYWSIAYTDSNDESTRIMVPGLSLWIAGNPSTNAVIKSGFTGTYNGMAMGTKTDTNGAITILNGTSQLTADFDALYPITSGNITFPGYITLTVDPTISSMTASDTTNSFTAAITGGGTSGGIKGSFYGPAANAVGFSFDSTGGGIRYLGIAGGKKQ